MKGDEIAELVDNMVKDVQPRVDEITELVDTLLKSGNFEALRCVLDAWQVEGHHLEETLAVLMLSKSQNKMLAWGRLCGRFLRSLKKHPERAKILNALKST